jgi:CBS domain-containing protein
MRATSNDDSDRELDDELDDLDDLDVSFAPGDRPVATVLAENVTRISPGTSLRDAAEILRREDVSIAVVGVGDAIDGVISERDFVSAIALGLDIDETTVDGVETHALKWATASSTIDDVAEEMLEMYVRHVLVCDDDGALVGLVSMRDLLSAYVV